MCVGNSGVPLRHEDLARYERLNALSLQSWTTTADASKLPSNPFKVTNALPIRDRVVERLGLQSRRVDVKIDHVIAERCSCHATAIQKVGRIAQRFWQAL